VDQPTNDVVYSLTGLLLSTAHFTTDLHAHILLIDIDDDDDECGAHRLSVVWRTDEQQGVSVAESHTLTLRQNDGHQLCLQSNVVAVSRQRQLVYSCDDHQDVVCYSRCSADDVTAGWRRRQGWSLTNQPDQLYSLTLSTDDTILLGQVVSGFKRWHVPTKRLVVLRLPSDVRNFPRCV